jgi:hypothetical protein
MSNLELFKGNSLVNSDLFKSLMDMNKKMAGGTGAAGKRISIRGGKFRMIVDGEQVAVNKNDTMNVVIVNAADVARTYYEGSFDPENPSAPTCWSLDTRAPASEVPEEQRKAARCADCPMNVKGSGQGDSRACRFSQRLAVVLEGDLDTVYQLQIPAKSLFGEAKGNDMGLQAYIKFLSAHNTPAIAVMTELRFDEDSTAPRLYFRPVRGLDEDELKSAIVARESGDATKAITFTVAQTDGVERAASEGAKAEPEPKPEPKPKPAPKPKLVEPVDEVIEDEEPVKVEKATKAPAPEPKTATKLASILSGWDDD